MKSLTQIIADGLDASVDGRGFSKEHADACALANAASSLRDASHNLLEILRSQPKGPQHDAMVILSDILALLPTGSTPAEHFLPTFTIFCQQADGRGGIHIASLEAENLEAAITAGIQTCAEDWDEENPANIHCLGVAAGDVDILEWNDIDF